MKETYATKHAHVKRINGVVILKPHGNLMGGEETDELEKLVDQFDGEGIACLVVNLVDVGMMNSLAISQLIRGHLKFTKRNARMHLCNLDSRIQNVFVIAKLSLVFNTYPSEEAAIAGFAKGEE
jgi:anti-anti-sigma factor